MSIISYEELSMNAWPALKTHLYDGWVLRFANGYTKRANSVHPIYSSTLSLEEKIAFCEAQYARTSLPSIFKLTKASIPQSLDDELDQLGYGKKDESSVQTLRLKDFTPLLPESVAFVHTNLAQWLPVFSSFNNLAVDVRETLGKMLGNSTCEACFGLLMGEGQPVACGLGVLSRDCLGLFDILVSSRHRGKGLGENLIHAILRWAKERRAQTAYLQVVMGNRAAETLYQKLGFKEVYRYWYRIKEVPPLVR